MKRPILLLALAIALAPLAARGQTDWSARLLGRHIGQIKDEAIVAGYKAKELPDGEGNRSLYIFASEKLQFQCMFNGENRCKGYMMWTPSAHTEVTKEQVLGLMFQLAKANGYYLTEFRGGHWLFSNTENDKLELAIGVDYWEDKGWWTGSYFVMDHALYH